VYVCECLFVCLWKIDSIAKKKLLKDERKRSKKWKVRDMKELVLE